MIGSQALRIDMDVVEQLYDLFFERLFIVRAGKENDVWLVENNFFLFFPSSQKFDFFTAERIALLDSKFKEDKRKYSVSALCAYFCKIKFVTYLFNICQIFRSGCLHHKIIIWCGVFITE